MSQTPKATEKRPAQSPAPEDFSEAIEQSMERQPDEQVRCVRVYEDRYRCNWWVRGAGRDWLAAATGSIRKSIFLRVTKQNDKLVIEKLSACR